MIGDIIYAIIFIVIALLIIFIVIIYIIFWKDMLPGTIVELNQDNKIELHDKLQVFEKKLAHSYPLGDDYFNISHGQDYYAFFERLGTIHMNCLIDNNEIVGNGIGVLRNIKYKDDKIYKTWYLCDLKVDPKYRGKHMPFKMGLKAKQKLNITDRIYGITMNKCNDENKVVRLANKIPLLKFKADIRLMIYSIDYDTLISIHDILTKHRGDISYLSLLNTKDLILQSTGLPMPLLHVQWTNDSNNDDIKITTVYPLKDYVYMFCVPMNDPLYVELTEIGVTTNTTAQIIYHNMDNCDWKFILTSDI